MHRVDVERVLALADVCGPQLRFRVVRPLVHCLAVRLDALPNVLRVSLEALGIGLDLPRDLVDLGPLCRKRLYCWVEGLRIKGQREREREAERERERER